MFLGMLLKIFLPNLIGKAKDGLVGALGEGAADVVLKQLEGAYTSNKDELDKQFSVLQESDKQQVGLLAIDAKSSRWFQAMPRPAFLWICIIAVFNAWIVSPYVQAALDAYGVGVTLPETDTVVILSALTGGLGMSAMRGFEKHNIRKDARGK